MCSTGDIFLGVIAILFPPLAVWVKCGICSADSVINILLCMLGYIPGLLHAWYIIAKYPEEASGYEAIPSRRDEERGGTVTYYYVQQGQPRYGGTNPNPPQAPLPSQAAHTLNAGAPAQHTGVTRADQGEGSSEGGVPPSYAEAVKGDNKVQK